MSNKKEGAKLNYLLTIKKLKIMILTIYITGFLLCYITTKIIRNKTDNNTINDVFGSLFMSIFSYIGFILLIILYIKENGHKELPSKLKKWL